MNPFDGQIPPGQIARMMRDPSKIAQFLTEDVPGLGSSGGAILADIINVQRADVRRQAEAVGVDIEVELMSEERAAELIAGIVDGNGIEIVEIFNELSEQRNEVLLELLDEDEHREFMQAKTSIMQTEQPDTFGTDVDDSEAE